MPLSAWFVFSIINLVGVDKEGLRVWVNGPVSFVLMVLFLIALFYHMQLGLQVVIEDYVHNEKNKVISLILNKLIAVFLVVSGITALMKIAFGG